MQMEDLRPKVEAFHVPGHSFSGLPPPPPPPPQQQQQQQPELHHRNHNQQQPPPLHKHLPHQPSTQSSATPFRLPDLYMKWQNQPEVPPPKDEHVHKLFAALGYEKCRKISWFPPRENTQHVCFAAVQDLHQLDNMMRLINRKARYTLDAYTVTVDLSKSNRDSVGPEVVVRFWPMSKSQPRSIISDVMDIAADARLPEPLNAGFSDRRDCDEFYFRYILPGQAEAFMAHCTQHPRFSREGFAWDLECCLQSSSASSTKRD
jgi:hypothetical protein